MGASLSVTAYAGKDSEEFKKHYKAVKFCLENGLSYPKETSDFFNSGNLPDNLEDYHEDSVLEMIENGVEIPLKQSMVQDHECRITVKVADIPKEVDTLIIEMR